MNPLWQQLVEAGLVTGDPPPSVAPGPAWYVTALLGFAAWIAALFLTIVIAMLARGQASIGFAGVFSCALGLVLLRHSGAFITQLGLAASIAGQAGMFFGVISWFHDFRSGAFALAAILIIPSVLSSNALYRAWCTAASLILLASALDYWAPLTVGLAAALLSVVFVALPGISRAYGYGAAVALVTIDALSLFGRSAHPYAGYAGGLLAGVALVSVAHHLLGTKGAIYAAVIALVLLPAQGVTAALLIIVIGFGRAAPVLLGLGLAAGLTYLGHYYYATALTLLMKSIVLIASGLLLLGLRWALFRQEIA